MNIYEIIAIIIISAIAIRVSFKFDLNRFLENRRKIKIDQLKNICPHCKIEISGKDKKQIKCTPYFSSPMGTPKWICSRCGCVVESEEDVNRICENYAKNPERFLRNEKRFIKQMKRLNLA